MKKFFQRIKSAGKTKFSADLVIRILSYLVLIAYVVILAAGSKIFDPMSLFWRSFFFFGKAGEYNPFIRIVSYIVFMTGASWFVRFLLKQLSKPLKKGKAIVDILCSLIKYAAIIVLLFLILKTVGVDTTAILAGIGILGLIVGLGAQPLIADIIAGLFIVFEKVFDVGDIIVVDGFRGTVKEIGIRTTQIVDVGGNVKIINNSDLKTVINMTNQLSLAICDLSIEYGESLERVEAILKKNLPAVKEAIPDIKDGPFYRGVAELGDSAVVIRFVANCEENVRYQVERDMNRQFKLIFDKNGINIPFPQIVLNRPADFKNATNAQKKDAQKFVDEQKELGKGLGDGQLNDF